MKNINLTEQNAPAPLAIKGLDRDVYAVEGGYGSGFFYHFLTVDLEELAAGNLDAAFTIDADVRDTNGQSFREYHGIDKSAKLPNGAEADSIRTLCENLAGRAAELAQGFSVEWDGSNQRAVWRDEDGDRCENFEHPGDYWTEQFYSDVADLTCTQIYDLSDTENKPFVLEAIRADERFEGAQNADDIEAMIHDIYDDAAEYYYLGFAQAAEELWEQIKEQREEEDA